MQLRVVQSTPKLILEWDPVPGATAGYRGRAEGVTKWTQTQQTRMTFAANATGIVIQALGVEDEGTYPSAPPPPTSTRNGPGYMRWVNGEFPTSHALDYDKVLCAWAGAPALGASAVALSKRGTYMSALSCREAAAGDWHFGVRAAEARSLNAVLKTSGGAELTNAGYPGSVLGDPGNVAYQQRWCENVYALLTQWNLGGVFIDDLQRNYITGIAGGAVAANYPGPGNAPIPAWEAAVTSFCKAIYEYMHARGKFVIWNAQAYIGGYYPASDTAQSTLEWWPSIIDYSDGMMSEYWMAVPGWPPVNMRRSNTGWLDALRIPAYCESKGKFLCCVAYEGVSSASAQYIILSMLLENKGILFAEGLWPNEWLPIYDQLLTLGSRVGSKFTSGSEYRQAVSSGKTVAVDPTAGTSRIF